MKKFLTSLCCVALLIITSAILFACSDSSKDTTTHVSTVAELTKAISEGKEITLDNNITTNQTIPVLKNVTINLNGKTIEDTRNFDAENSRTAFDIKSNGFLTINGNGTIKTKKVYIFSATGSSKLTINDGNYETTSRTIVQVDQNAVANIKGGTFEMKDGTYKNSTYKDFYQNNGTWQKYVLDKIDKSKETSKIIVEGGTFVGGYDPANSTSEDPAENFVFNGYKAVKESNKGITSYKVVKK